MVAFVMFHPRRASRRKPDVLVCTRRAYASTLAPIDRMRARETVMLVVMNSHATPEEVDAVLAAVRRMNLTPHPMPGATRTAIGITGNISAVDPRSLEVLPGVMELIRVTKPYKLASREMHEADTYVKIPQTTIGPGTFTLIAGPCSVENESMIRRTAEFLREQGVKLMRAGAFKPRSSPYSFQ